MNECAICLQRFKVDKLKIYNNHLNCNYKLECCDFCIQSLIKNKYICPLHKGILIYDYFQLKLQVSMLISSEVLIIIISKIFSFSAIDIIFIFSLAVCFCLLFNCVLIVNYPNLNHSLRRLN